MADGVVEAVRAEPDGGNRVEGLERRREQMKKDVGGALH